MSTKLGLRPLDFQPVIYQGQQMWYLRDPLRLTSHQLIMPPVLAQMLVYVDGTRDAREIHSAFSRHVGEPVDFAVIRDALEQLDAACLLENERSREVMARQLEAYRAQPHRAAALAGLSYPADPEELQLLFAEYAAGDDLADWPGWKGRALVSPHIDYMRGGPVYARVWRRAAEAVAEADLVVIFGTDHNGGENLITLTQQAYATPFGVLPPEEDLVRKLAAAYGTEAAFAGELHHRDEHSIELSAVWLHYMFAMLGREVCPVVPVLCGSFAPFVWNGSHPDTDVRLSRFIEALRRETAGQKVLAVASVDFAHVGPNFGDSFRMDARRRQQLQTSDKSLIEAVSQGDQERFYAEIAGIQDQNRICGFSSIYTMLSYLNGPDAAPLEGTEVAYVHCPADEEDSSLVSISGLLLT